MIVLIYEYLYNMTLLIAYFLIALLFSFLCSLIESVILSITPSFVTKKLQEGNDYALYLKTYKNNIDRPLAAILTLNTFAHTLGAAGGIGCADRQPFGARSGCGYRC